LSAKHRETPCCTFRYWIEPQHFCSVCTHSVWLVVESSLIEASDKESQELLASFSGSPSERRRRNLLLSPFGESLRTKLKYSRSPTVLLLVQCIHHMKPWKWFTVASKLVNKRSNTLELVYFGSRNCKCDITQFMLATNFISNCNQQSTVTHIT